MQRRVSWSWMVGCALFGLGCGERGGGGGAEGPPIAQEQATQARPIVGAAGRRTASARYVLISVTGQSTPVAMGPSVSTRFEHVPGAGGQQR